MFFTRFFYVILTFCFQPRHSQQPRETLFSDSLSLIKKKCTHIKVWDEKSCSGFLWFFRFTKWTFMREEETTMRCIIKYALCTYKNKYNDCEVLKLCAFYVISICWLAPRELEHNGQLKSLCAILIANNEIIKFLHSKSGWDEEWKRREWAFRFYN